MFSHICIFVPAVLLTRNSLLIPNLFLLKPRFPFKTHYEALPKPHIQHILQTTHTSMHTHTSIDSCKKIVNSSHRATSMKCLCV